MLSELFLRPTLWSAGLAATVGLLARFGWRHPRAHELGRIAATALGAYAAYVHVRFQDWLPSVTSRVDHAVYALPLGAVLGAWTTWQGRRSATWWAAATLSATWLGVTLHDLPQFGVLPRVASAALLLMLVLSTAPLLRTQGGTEPRTLGLWFAFVALAAAGPRAYAVSIGLIALASGTGHVVASAVLPAGATRRPLAAGPLLALLLGGLLLGAHTYSQLPLVALLLLAGAPVAEFGLGHLRLRGVGRWVPAAVALGLSIAGVIVTQFTNPGWNIYAR